MSEPQFRIKDKLYPIPQNERAGELRLIERVTGLTNREFRLRALDQDERFAEIDDDTELTTRQMIGLTDDLVTLARVAQAVQRANPSWSTEKVASFVDQIDTGEINIEGGEQEKADDVPPPSGELDAEKNSPNGTDSAPPLNSGSDSDSSESPSPQTSGTPISPTSQGAPSLRAAWPV